MSKQVTNLLDELAAQMQNANLWDALPPEADKLQSTQPFSVDTLEFYQWLQFIFIPRMQALLEGGLPLPSGSGVYPMAEQALGDDVRYKQVVAIIYQIDGVLGRADYQG